MQLFRTSKYIYENVSNYLNQSMYCRILYPFGFQISKQLHVLKWFCEIYFLRERVYLAAIHLWSRDDDMIYWAKITKIKKKTKSKKHLKLVKQVPKSIDLI